MKNLLMSCFIAIIALSLNACSQAQIEEIPSGFISCDEHWDKSGFQDYTDYCKYTYSSADKFTHSFVYSEITKDDVEAIGGYFDNFEEWMKVEERLNEYDFQKKCINAGDYIRIIEKHDQYQYEDYSLYFFDMETLTLYYIHANI